MVDKLKTFLSPITPVFRVVNLCSGRPKPGVNRALVRVDAILHLLVMKMRLCEIDLHSLYAFCKDINYM